MPAPSSTPLAASAPLIARFREAISLERRPWLPTAGVALVAVYLMGGSVFLHPWREAIGSAYTEALGHMWGLWCTAQGLWEHGPFVRVAAISYPEGYTSHLMDPINLLLFLPFYWLGGSDATGATLGWNALHAGAVVLGAYGVYRLGRRLMGEHPSAPWAIAVGAMIFCASPYLLQVPFMGRTEYLPAVLYPWHLALLHQWLRSPAGLGPVRYENRKPVLEAPPGWGVGLAAGLVLGAIALGGWYVAVFVFLLEVPISLWMARHLPWREALWRLAFVAVLGVACSLPALWALAKYPPDGGTFFGGGDKPKGPITLGDYPIVGLTEMFRLSPKRMSGQWMDQSPYVGVVSLILGIIGVLFYFRRAVPWYVLVLWALILAAGPFAPINLDGLTPAQAMKTLKLPVYFMISNIEDLRPLRNWSRLAVLGALPAAVVAMHGFAALAPRKRAALNAFGLLILGLVVADHGSYPKSYEWERPSFKAGAPKELLHALEQLPPGPVINFPLDVALRSTGGPEIHGHFLLWQLEHHRPIPTSFRGIYDTTLWDSPLTRLAVLVQLAGVKARGGELDPAAALTSAPPEPSNDEVLCARSDVKHLKEVGYVGASLQQDLPGAGGLTEFLTAVLGPPTVTETPVLVWDLNKARTTFGDVSCDLPYVKPSALARGGGGLDRRPSWARATTGTAQQGR